MASGSHVQLLVGQLDGAGRVLRQELALLLTQVLPILGILPCPDDLVKQHDVPSWNEQLTSFGLILPDCNIPSWRRLLIVYERGIGTAEGHQLLMHATFHDGALI